MSSQTGFSSKHYPYSQEDKLDWGIMRYQPTKLSLLTRHFTRHVKPVDPCYTKQDVSKRPTMSTIHEIRDTASEHQCDLYCSCSTNVAGSRTSFASNRTYSPVAVENGDTSNFPLSLFPEPPPLTVRKKVPRPLNFYPASSQCSINSMVIGLPGSPQRMSLTSPSQTSFSPSKKGLGRPISSVSPPPTSPPNSPLPSPPADLPQEAKSSRTSITAISVRHRLISRESIADESVAFVMPSD